MYIIKRHILLLIKRIEFWYKTFLNKLEVKKAYSSKFIVWPRVDRPVVLRFFRVIVIGFGFILAIFFLYRYWPASVFHGVGVDRQPSIAQTDSVSASIKDSPDEKDTGEGEAQKEPVVETIDSSLYGEYPNAWKPQDTMGYIIIANKTDKKMNILRNDGGIWKRFREYSIAIGENGGQKLRRGDKRTPEGIYFIVGRKDKSELSIIYGPLAYVLNYPNTDDKIAGRTGEGIWIHGTAPDSTPVNTRGCIELDNNNIEELGSMINIGVGTPVLIVNEKNLSAPEKFPNYKEILIKRRKVLAEYLERQNYFVGLAEKWKKSWESRDAESYAAFYDNKSFFSQGMAWDMWIERKARIFENTSSISIALEKVLLADYSDSKAVIKFIQRYISDAIVSVSGKKLTFIKIGDKWKISSESTFPEQELLL